VFTVQVKVGKHQQIATGKSIKEAEKEAARKLLNRLKK
jgi:dsRNA-specific ribonuclease